MPIRASLVRLLAAASLIAGPAIAAGAQETPPPVVNDKGMMMLTIFLKHDQSKTLDRADRLGPLSDGILPDL